MNNLSTKKILNFPPKPWKIKVNNFQQKNIPSTNILKQLDQCYTILN